jgi:preprotein translocase subunit SecE
MAMNRAQKRMLQKQGALGADGQPQRAQPAARKAPAAPRQEEKEGRTGPRQFLKEVRGELRKVAWPTRAEVINYSIIVLIAVLVMMAFIALVDYGVAEFVLTLFDE